jgi:hypothetical protein
MSYLSSFPQYLEDHNGFVAPLDVFAPGQYDPQRSKTPTSLINHAGNSPGPLSTPPLSRTASQGPEQLPANFPESLLYDDTFGSPSNSPNSNSVKTPDDNSPDVDPLDLQMRDFVQNQNGPMDTQQLPQGMPTLNTNLNYGNQNMLQDQGKYTQLLQGKKV